MVDSLLELALELVARFGLTRLLAALLEGLL